MLNPQHLIEARADVEQAIQRRVQAETNERDAAQILTRAQNRERTAIDNGNRAQQNLEAAQRNLTAAQRELDNNTAQWRRDTLARQRDDARNLLNRRQGELTTAQTEINNSIAGREAAERNVEESPGLRVAAAANEAEAIRRKDSVERTWDIFIFLLGIGVGIIGLLPFFSIYKKFGFKLFALNFSIYGFSLSSVAIANPISQLLLWLSCIVAVYCLILFVFRPNLVIGIKNKSGLCEGVVDVRRKPINLFAIFMMDADKGSGFTEVIPTPESEICIRELWAIISDIQKMGDYAVEKWKK